MSGDQSSTHPDRSPDVNSRGLRPFRRPPAWKSYRTRTAFLLDWLGFRWVIKLACGEMLVTAYRWDWFMSPFAVGNPDLTVDEQEQLVDAARVAFKRCTAIGV